MLSKRGHRQIIASGTPASAIEKMKFLCMFPCSAAIIKFCSILHNIGG